MDSSVKYFLLLVILISSFSMVLNSEGESYESIVIFRNDDVSTLNSEFSEFNRIFENQDVPVTHSVIPENFEQSRNFSAECDLLQEYEANGTEFAIHGYNHNGSEFKNSDWNQIKDKIDNIESFSESCLDRRPKVFVPPQNAMSSSARILLNESGFEVISADRKMAWQTGSVTVREDRTDFLEERPLELGQSSMMVDRWDTEPVQFENLSYIQSEFDNSVENNEIHVQVLHYKALMRNNQSEKLENLIDYMEEENVYFTSFDELTNLFENDRIRFNGEKWVIDK